MLPDFVRNGIAVFAISYDPGPVLAKFAETHGIQYPLLADEGSQVIRRLGLFNEHVYEHHAAYGIPKREMFWGVPYPGAFLLAEDGRVLQKRFQQSYRERETGAALLEQGFGGRSSFPKAQTHAQGEEVMIRAMLDSDTYRWFQRLWLTVEVTPALGLHVYGQPIPDGYIPLSVEVEPIDGLEIGLPEFPTPQPYRIAGLDEEFFVYERHVEVSVPLTFTREGDDLTLHLTVRYQACSEADCFPPQTVRLQLPVKAADLIEWPQRKE
jgi:cytochrome c biogenesis DsbD-like protein/AhpC/TSA family protein